MGIDPYEAKNKHKDFLWSFPHVKGLGVGNKKIKGKSTKILAIKIFVDKKIPIEDLTEEQCIPSQIDGIPTDVEELGPLNSYSET